MATAGSIVIDLLMKTGAFETDSKRAEKRLAALGKEAQRVGKVIGTAIAGGAIAVATGLTAMVKGAIDSADAIRDLSIRTGVSTETLSAFGYAASQTGTDIDILAKGMKVLSKNVADSLNPTSEQSKVFKALGIEVTDAEGKLRDIGDLIPEIADRFKAMEDGTTKAALAQALFGRAGLDLTEFLNQGSAGLAEFTDRARELGIVLDSDTAAAADDFNDTLGDLKAVTQGYALALAKELLPDLQSLADSFRDTATEGNKVKDMAQGTADFLRGLATVAHIVSSAFEIVGTGIATVIAQGQAAVKFLSGDLRGAVSLWREASLGLDAEINEALGRGGRTGPFANVRSSASRTVSQLPSVDTAAVGRALSNPTAPKASKGGKSEAEKEADQLARAYDSLIEGQNEQIALHGQITEAARVRYEVEHGALTGLTEAQKALAIQNAEHIDMLDDIAAHEELVAEIAKDQAEEQKRLTEAYEDRMKSNEQLLKDMQFELDLLGMTNDERERAIALSYLSADATDAQKEAVSALADELGRALKAEAFWDDFQSSMSDAFFDFATGAKSAKDALGDFIDAIYSSSIKAASDYFAESLANMFKGLGGSGSSGSSGGDGGWGDLFAAIGGFFGGAKAGGGDVFGNRPYLIGEQGPEMFIPRTAGTIVPAAQTAAMARGGTSQTNIFQFAAPTSPKTQTQIAARQEYLLQRAARFSAR